MRILYNISIHFYVIGIYISSLFNFKARQWIEGRKNIFKNLQSAINGHANIVWFHCASLGEFEQGKPIIEAYKIKFPSYKILLTFFSPSGYEIRKNASLVDFVFYLPADTKSNAKKFLENEGNPYHYTGLDENGKIGLEFGVFGLPETFLTNNKGEIIYKHLGPLSKKIVQNEILPLLQ